MYLQPRVLVVVAGIAVLAHGATAVLACIALSVFITYDLATATKSSACVWMTVVLAAPTSGIALLAVCVATSVTTFRFLAIHAAATAIMVALLACIVSSSARGRSLLTMNITLNSSAPGRQRQRHRRHRHSGSGVVDDGGQAPSLPRVNGSAPAETITVFGFQFLHRRLGVHVVYLVTHALVWAALAFGPGAPLLALLVLVYTQSVIVTGAGLKVELDVVDFVMTNPHVRQIMKIRSELGQGLIQSAVLYESEYGDEDGFDIPPTIANIEKATMGTTGPMYERSSIDVSSIMKIPLPSEASPTQFLRALLKTLRVQSDA